MNAVCPRSLHDFIKRINDMIIDKISWARSKKKKRIK